MPAASAARAPAAGGLTALRRGPPPVTLAFSVSPPLPNGLALDPATGAVSGTPLTNFEGNFTVIASTSGGSASGPLSVRVAAAVAETRQQLYYALLEATYTLNEPIAPNAPVRNVFSSFSVAPALPAGLSLNANTGAISGTPVELTCAPDTVHCEANSQGCRSVLYTVTAFQRFSATSNAPSPTSIVLRLRVLHRAPSSLTYPDSPVTLFNSTPAALQPDVDAAFAIFSVTPALPAGLSLDAATGGISGVPTGEIAAATYVVLAGNTGGCVATELVLSVVERPPVIAYEPSVLNITVFFEAAVLSSGGRVSFFSVQPRLPEGITLDAATGTVRGVLVGVYESQTHTVYAYNSGGAASAEITLRTPYVTNTTDTDPSLATTYVEEADASAMSMSVGAIIMLFALAALVLLGFALLRHFVERQEKSREVVGEGACAARRQHAC